MKDLFVVVLVKEKLEVDVGELIGLRFLIKKLGFKELFILCLLLVVIVVVLNIVVVFLLLRRV